jgi:hypothetical protein
MASEKVNELDDPIIKPRSVRALSPLDVTLPYTVKLLAVTALAESVVTVGGVVRWVIMTLPWPEL